MPEMLLSPARPGQYLTNPLLQIRCAAPHTRYCLNPGKYGKTWGLSGYLLLLLLLLRPGYSPLLSQCLPTDIPLPFTVGYLWRISGASVAHPTRNPSRYLVPGC